MCRAMLANVHNVKLDEVGTHEMIAIIVFLVSLMFFVAHVVKIHVVRACCFENKDQRITEDYTRCCRVCCNCSHIRQLC